MQTAVTPDPHAKSHTIPALSSLSMMFLGFLVGIIGGFGAVVFRMMISLFHNLLFHARFDLMYDANVHTPPSVWGMGVILVPVVGALGVAWIIKTFAPEAKGHGVPEVIDAIYYNEGKIRPMVAFFKSIASALSIGSGGSVGREGPIIQIGSAFGSTIGQWIKMPVRQRLILIAAGAGAGIAATFNAPIGGVAFAIELLLVSVNAGTIAVVAIATITAAYIGRLFLGMAPAFNIPELARWGHGQLTNVWGLLLFIPFGALIGVLGTLFIKSIYWFEDKFEELPLNDYLTHMLGMLILGVMMYLFMRYSGHYYVQGVGYATIVDVLKNTLTNPWFLLLLCFAKLLATSLTLGSGASGGVFSPALFLGASMGGFFGQIIQYLFPHLGIDPSVFAVAGMAGMVSGTTGAVLTAITMLFEMTRDYHAILPVVLTVGLAYVTRAYLSKESIYTMKLLRRGHAVHEGLQAAVSAAQRAKHVMNKNFHKITQEELDQDLEQFHDPAWHDQSIIVEQDGKITGLLHYTFANETPRQALDKHFVCVPADAGLIHTLREMKQTHADFVCVMKNPNSAATKDLLGVISCREVVGFSQRVAELVS